jgi:hypothetical protein
VIRDLTTQGPTLEQFSRFTNHDSRLSEIRVQATRIQNACRVERLFQVAVQFHQGRRERVEHACRLVAAAE